MKFSVFVSSQKYVIRCTRNCNLVLCQDSQNQQERMCWPTLFFVSIQQKRQPIHTTPSMDFSSRSKNVVRNMTHLFENRLLTSANETKKEIIKTWRCCISRPTDIDNNPPKSQFYSVLMVFFTLYMRTVCMRYPTGALVIHLAYAYVSPPLEHYLGGVNFNFICFDFIHDQ